MRIILALCFSLFAAFPAAAQDVKADIQGVISGQIEALSAGDFERAFSFASKTLHGVFRTPENFGMMVNNGYGMILNPRDVAFQGLELRDGVLFEKVLITDANGGLHTLIYEMIETPDGLRINAVQLIPNDLISA